jgi:predicted glycosyltransferase
MRNRPARIMIYCQDSFGLGHLRRNVNIAHEVSRRAPGTSILFVADSPLAPFFELPRNSDFVKLPTLVKVSHGDWEVHRLPLLSSARLLEIRAQLIREVALSFQPDLLLVDHMPHGASGELVGCLEALGAHHPRTRIVLGLRDILGAPEDIIPQWRARGAYELLAKHYDQVLVYGSRENYDLAAAYEFPPQVERLVRYCGYVATRKRRFPKAAARLASELRGDRQFVALVMGGGGSDAHFFMDMVLEAIRSLGEEVPFHTFMLTGPFMPPEDRKALEEKARVLPVLVRRFRDDSTKIMQMADVVISMAGYNTACEILRFARSAVLIPREGPSVEQSMRAAILHARGLVHAIHPRDLTPRRLAAAILERLLGAPRAGARAVDLGGAGRAARIALGLAREAVATAVRRVA